MTLIFTEYPRILCSKMTMFLTTAELFVNYWEVFGLIHNNGTSSFIMFDFTKSE